MSRPDFFQSKIFSSPFLILWDLSHTAWCACRTSIAAGRWEEGAATVDEWPGSLQDLIGRRGYRYGVGNHTLTYYCPPPEGVRILTWTFLQTCQKKQLEYELNFEFFWPLWKKWFSWLTTDQSGRRTKNCLGKDFSGSCSTLEKIMSTNQSFTYCSNWFTEILHWLNWFFIMWSVEDDQTFCETFFSRSSLHVLTWSGIKLTFFQCSGWLS